MDGRLTVEDGSLYDFLDLVGAQHRAGAAATDPDAALRRRSAARSACSSNTIRSAARKNVATITICRDTLYDSSSTATGNIPAPISPTPTISLEEAQAQQEAPHRREAAAEAGAEGARYRLRLGRARALSRQGMPMSRSPASPCRSSSSRSRERRAAAAGLADRVKFELRDYREVTGQLRPHRLGRHVRACRRRRTTRPSSAR